MLPRVLKRRDESFARAFRSGARESLDDVQMGLTLRYRIRTVGRLRFPTGWIVACDPFLRYDEPTPFTRKVKPGTYPVRLCFGEHPEGMVIAFAKVEFDSGSVEKWEMALRPGQDVEKLEGNQFFGYGVDSGTGCFADVDAMKAFARNLNEDYDNFSASAIKALNSGDGEKSQWANIQIDDGKKRDIAIFNSGAGDGAYASYFGLTQRGRVLCLMTDFNIVPWHMAEYEDDE